jgi:ribosome maturation factor RimP
VGPLEPIFFSRDIEMDVVLVLARVEETVSPVLEQLGYQLVERELVPQAGGWVLRLYIDKEGGVTIDDCARASRGIEDLIEVEELVPAKYTLEVSSPGVDRPLRRRQDFERYRGSTIRLKTHHPVNGRSNYKGTLEGLEGDDIVMTVDGVRYRLPISELAKARVEAKV